MRFILFKHTTTLMWNPALFAASADTCFETNDCFLNFDVKTVVSNDTDADYESWGRIQTEANQISYPDNITNVTLKNKPHAGITVKYDGPNFPTKIEDKYTTTFFLQSSWSSTKDKIRIENSRLSLIPNGLLAKNMSKYGKYGDLIESFKDTGYGECEYCDFKTSFDSGGFKKFKIHGCTKQRYQKIKYHVCKQTARFVVSRFREPQFSKDWSRSELLPDYN